MACRWCPRRLTQTEDEAAAAAAALGFPVAMKVESPDLPHKTEAGVIRLKLKDAAEVRDAYRAVMANAHHHAPDARINGVLVQPMAKPGVEVMVGGRVDPLMGPLIVAGLGGVLVELMRDSSLALAPVTHTEARAMFERLRGRAALDGFRGAPAADLDRLADIVTRLSEFVADQRERVAELDVNPIIVAGIGGDGGRCLDREGLNRRSRRRCRHRPVPVLAGDASPHPQAGCRAGRHSCWLRWAPAAPSPAIGQCRHGRFDRCRSATIHAAPMKRNPGF